jgi:hypothetical protein
MSLSHLLAKQAGGVIQKCLLVVIYSDTTWRSVKQFAWLKT